MLLEPYLKHMLFFLEPFPFFAEQREVALSPEIQLLEPAKHLQVFVNICECAFKKNRKYAKVLLNI